MEPCTYSFKTNEMNSARLSVVSESLVCSIFSKLRTLCIGTPEDFVTRSPVEERAKSQRLPVAVPIGIPTPAQHGGCSHPIPLAVCDSAASPSIDLSRGCDTTSRYKLIGVLSTLQP